LSLTALREIALVPETSTASRIGRSTTLIRMVDLGGVLSDV
jgi:hypothetical protein